MTQLKILAADFPERYSGDRETASYFLATIFCKVVKNLDAHLPACYTLTALNKRKRGDAG